MEGGDLENQPGRRKSWHAPLCLETHEFHNYCIMLQEGAIPGRLPACLSALPVCLPALAALPACSTPTFVVQARARTSSKGGGERLG